MLIEVEEALSVRRRDLMRVDTDLDSATDRHVVYFTNKVALLPPRVSQWCGRFVRVLTD